MKLTILCTEDEQQNVPEVSDGVVTFLPPLCESDSDCAGNSVNPSWVKCLNEKCKCLNGFQGDGTSENPCRCDFQSVVRDGVPQCLV